VISRSGGKLDAVLQTLTETAARICEADTAAIIRLHDDRYWLAASFGLAAEWGDYVSHQSVEPSRTSITGRAALERRVIHVEDVTTDPEYGWLDAQRLGKYRTALGVPLLRNDQPTGVITLSRRRVERFTDKQVALVRTFADQAVIAIENARLIIETREALEQQTATAEVLQVINSSPGDLAPVFDAILNNAMGLCEAAFGLCASFDGEHFRYVALRGAPTNSSIASARRYRPCPEQHSHGWSAARRSCISGISPMTTRIDRATPVALHWSTGPVRERPFGGPCARTTHFSVRW
jgi:two-component system, NtrC family, sensor kinase